jgi:N-acetylglutamate synthase-like GNAT family acetyltransferase
MIKIRRLKSSDIKKVQEMIEYVQPGTASCFLPDDYFSHFPLDLIHNILPPHLKFMQECFVAIEDKKVLGLIGLIPDGKQKTRWEVNRLVLDINSHKIGQQLIEYIINRYGGSGVETFLTKIDERYPEAIALFKDACKFRSCSQIYIWEKDDFNDDTGSYKDLFLRDARFSDAKQLQELDAQSLFPQFRTSLLKNISDFRFSTKKQVLNYFRGYKVERLVLDNPKIKSIESYVLIVSRDNNNFWADITLSLAYQEYYEDILNYIINYVKTISDKPKLYVYVRQYYQSSKKLSEVVNNLNFKLKRSFQVLSKDYWKMTPLATEGKKSPIVIFPDITSPACSSLEMNKTGR